MKNILCPLLLLGWLMVGSASAKVVYVNQDMGDDVYTGLMENVQGNDGPVKTFSRGLSLLAPGDTLSVAPTPEPYTEEMLLTIEATEDERIIIEGNGATIDIGRDISEGPWTEEDGYWRLSEPLPGDKQTAFAFYRGIPIARPLSAPAEGEFPAYFSAIDGSNGTTLVRMPEGMRPPFKCMYKPGGSKCIKITGGKYLTIRNFNLRGASNDGIGLHGDALGIIVENCTSILCGDEGTSAHGPSEAEFVDCIFAWNGSLSGGVTDVHETKTDYLRCISAFGRGRGYSFQGSAYKLIDSYSLGNLRAEDNLPSNTVEIVNFTDISNPDEAMAEIIELSKTDAKMARLLELAKEVGWGTGQASPFSVNEVDGKKVLESFRFWNESTNSEKSLWLYVGDEVDLQKLRIWQLTDETEEWIEYPQEMFSFYDGWLKIIVVEEASFAITTPYSQIEIFRRDYNLAQNGADDTADLSQNGIPNILYLAFGLGDPGRSDRQFADLASNRPGLPAAMPVSDSGSLTFAYSRLTAMENLHYSPLVSTDLKNWVLVSGLVGTPNQPSTTINSIDGTYEMVSLRFPNGDIRFFRVDVSIL